MHKIVMFPGQGAQKLGMGEKYFPRFPELVEQADEILGFSLKELCLQDPRQQLAHTQFTQPALYAVCCLIHNALKEDGLLTADAYTGHSLGLYPALYAAGYLDFATGLSLVATRGALMQQASGGGMMAVIGKDVAAVPDKLVSEEFFDIDVANYNSPDQIVISGPNTSIEALKPVLEESGFVCVVLAVSGAFHSRYMEDARRQYLQTLTETKFKEPEKPVISSTNAEILQKSHLIEELSFQLTQPVRWQQSVSALCQRYPEVQFQEIGPGQVLTKLNKKILGGPTLPASQLSEEAFQ